MQSPLWNQARGGSGVGGEWSMWHLSHEGPQYSQGSVSMGVKQGLKPGMNSSVSQLALDWLTARKSEMVSPLGHMHTNYWENNSKTKANTSTSSNLPQELDLRVPFSASSPKGFACQ